MNRKKGNEMEKYCPCQLRYMLPFHMLQNTCQRLSSILHPKCVSNKITSTLKTSNHNIYVDSFCRKHICKVTPEPKPS